MKYRKIVVPWIASICLILSIVTFIFIRFQALPSVNMTSILTLYLRQSWTQTIIFILFYLFYISYIAQTFENASVVLSYSSKNKIFFHRAIKVFVHTLLLYVFYSVGCLVFSSFFSQTFTLSHLTVMVPLGDPFEIHVGIWFSLQVILNAVIMINVVFLTLILSDLTKNTKWALGVSAFIFCGIGSVSVFGYNLKELMGNQPLETFSVAGYMGAILFWVCTLCCLTEINRQVFKRYKDFGMTKEIIE